MVRFFCMWLVACAWGGCAAKGGSKPWEGILSSGGFQGDRPGAGGQGEGAGAEEDRLVMEDSDDPAAFSPVPWEEAALETVNSFPEDLEPSWRRALSRVPILEIQGQDHPVVKRFAQEFRRQIESPRGRPITRSSVYLPRMLEIFREEGVPEELVYIAFVESRFNPWVTSGGKCVGMWQFTEATGRRYGLRIDSWVDERRDPEKSTRAAARYLRDLYQTFRSWDLVIAAYNAGEAAVTSSFSLANKEVSNFWDLLPSGGLSRSTMEFVPRVIAAIQVARDEKLSSTDLGPAMDLWRFDRVRVQEHLELATVARLLGCTEEELKDLNPHLKGNLVHPGASGLEIRVPEGKGDEMKQLLANPGKLVRPARFQEATQREFRAHRVQPGDTLKKLARRYGTTVEELSDVNLLSRDSKLRPGRELLVPVSRSWQGTHGGDSGGEGSTRTGPSSTKGDPGPKIHKVGKGESLWSISRRYGLTVDDLLRWNGLKGYLVQPGDCLKVAP